MHVSTFYFYLLKYIFYLLSTFQKVENFKTTFTFWKVEFLANTCTFWKVTKSSAFDNTVDCTDRESFLMDLLAPSRSPNSAFPLHIHTETVHRREVFHPCLWPLKAPECALGKIHQASRQPSNGSTRRVCDKSTKEYTIIHFCHLYRLLCYRLLMLTLWSIVITLFFFVLDTQILIIFSLLNSEMSRIGSRT